MIKADFEFDIDKHEKFFFAQLSERDKRQYAGLEAMKLGYYGVKSVSIRLCINKHTVRKGKDELLKEIVLDAGRIRKKGGGRKKKLS